MSSVLSIKNLQVRVPEKEILKGLDLEIKEGEIHAIMGLNGSGKSTLLNLLGCTEISYCFSLPPKLLTSATPSTPSNCLLTIQS